MFASYQKICFKVWYDDVGFFDKLNKLCVIISDCQVELLIVFIVIDAWKISRCFCIGRFFSCFPGSGNVSFFRMFDFYNLCSKFCKKSSCRWSGKDSREVNNLYFIQINQIVLFSSKQIYTNWVISVLDQWTNHNTPFF